MSNLNQEKNNETSNLCEHLEDIKNNDLWREVAVDDSRFSHKGKKNALIAGAHGL